MMTSQIRLQYNKYYLTLCHLTLTGMISQEKAYVKQFYDRRFFILRAYTISTLDPLPIRFSQRRSDRNSFFDFFHTLNHEFSRFID